MKHMVLGGSVSGLMLCLHVEVKCQLDATDVFIADFMLAQHVSGTIMPIIRSSRVLYSLLPPVVFGAWFLSCPYGVELRVVCPVCGQTCPKHVEQAKRSAIKNICCI
jgi:hypothetical protein